MELASNVLLPYGQRRSIFNRRAFVDALACRPMKYRAHIYGHLGGGACVDIVGATMRTEVDAIHSARLAAWDWLGGGSLTCPMPGNS